ncbi:MAG: tryptophan synthase subunit alpha, partial [Elusimicrobiota bacterium]|nr:tryptophan synthase subunit alpha [Elusimicrobiota bacterium]
KKVRTKTTKPLLLGFGISNPVQIDNLKEYIDGIIIGSALLKIVSKSGSLELNKRIKNFLIPFRKVLN